MGTKPRVSIDSKDRSSSVFSRECPYFLQVFIPEELATPTFSNAGSCFLGSLAGSSAVAEPARAGPPGRAIYVSWSMNRAATKNEAVYHWMSTEQLTAATPMDRLRFRKVDFRCEDGLCSFLFQYVASNLKKRIISHSEKG